MRKREREKGEEEDEGEKNGTKNVFVEIRIKTRGNIVQNRHQVDYTRIVD